MQIAIVDDRADDREELSACLENYMKKHQLDYTLTEFEDGENFLKAAAQVNLRPPEGYVRKTGSVRSFF